MPGIVKLVWKHSSADSSHRAHYKNHNNLRNIIESWEEKLGDTFKLYHIHIIPCLKNEIPCD